MEEQISERNLAISCKVKVTLHPSNSKHTCVTKHTLPTKVHIVKAMVFPVVMYGCESCTRKKAECQRIDTFKLWCWRRLLRIPWTARKWNQSILKEINTEYSLKGLDAEAEPPILWPPGAKSRLIGKDPDAGKDWKQKEKGVMEDEMVG